MIFSIILIGPMPIPIPEQARILPPALVQSPFLFCAIAIITGGAAPIGPQAKAGSPRMAQLPGPMH